MVLQIAISTDAEAKLREQAAQAGQRIDEYAARLVERMLNQPSLDTLLAPFRAAVAASGESDAELESFYEGLRDEVWRQRSEKH